MEQTFQQFFDQLSESRLLSDDDLAALRESLGDDRETLADVTNTLIEQRKLTKFQADQICRGEGAKLVLGKYLLVDEIGAGGMGRVFLAEHRQMRRRVALKTLPPAMIEDQQAVERFQREVQAAAQLMHPNIVTAYDADEAHGMHFFVMAYVKGADLRKLVASMGPFSVAQTIDCVKQVAKGLDYAHRKGIVHRDIKPGNLLLDPEGTVKILDVGLARYQTSGEVSEGLTISGMTMGTADFMAPEQGVNAKNADARSDIYSLGCTLYFLLTGRKVYHGESVVEKIIAHQHQPIPELSVIRPDVPSELSAIFKKMMAKQPEERFQSAGEVMESLAKLSGLDELSNSGHKSKAPLSSLAGAAFGPTELSPSPINQSATGDFVPSVAEDNVKQTSEVEPALPSPARRRWALIAGGLLALLVLLAGLISKLQTEAGYIVLEIDQPEIVGAQVLIDGEKNILIRNGKGTEQIWLAPGKERHQIEVQMAGFHTFTEEFKHGSGNKTIKVALVPLGSRADFDKTETKPARTSSSGKNWALEFNGKDDYVDLPTLRCAGQHPLTVELWVRSSAVQRNKGKLVILEGGVFSLANTPRGTWSFDCCESKRAVIANSDEEQTPELTHLAGVYDGSSISLYVNGVKQGTFIQFIYANGGTSLSIDAPTGLVPVIPDKQFMSAIGGAYIGLREGWAWRGHMFEVRISNTVRYTEDFTPEKYFENDEQTTALFHFNEGDGDVLTDSSGNGHHGKIVGAKWVRIDDQWKLIEEAQATAEATAYQWPEDQPAPAITPFSPEEARLHQDAWAKNLGVPVESENSLGMKFRVIPPGEFLVGASEDEMKSYLEWIETKSFHEAYANALTNRVRWERPQHKAVITTPFQIGNDEVNLGQFRQFIESSDYIPEALKEQEKETSRDTDSDGISGDSTRSASVFNPGKGDDNPAVNVTWYDAVAFCEWLSEKEGVVYRLPTEAEWEYVCRAGSVGQFCWGNDYSGLAKYAKYAGVNVEGSTNPSGKRSSNAFGLYDVHGSVWEWCADPPRLYDEENVVDPVGSGDDTHRAFRGGAFTNPPTFLRSAHRVIKSPLVYAHDVGFRIVRTFDKFDLKAVSPVVPFKPNESPEPESTETKAVDETAAE